MNVLMTCTPGLGHFHPMVPLARALHDGGHRVTFVTSSSFRPWIERAGLSTVTAGSDWVESEPELAFPDLEGNPRDLRGLVQLVTASFYRAGAALYPDLLRIIEELKPDVLIHEQEEFITPLAGERTGVPWVCLGLCYRQPLGVSRQGGALWSQARVQRGLSPDPYFERLWPYLYLDSYPPSLHPLPAGVLAVAHQLRPIPFEVGDREPPSWLVQVPDRPTIYVTMGTVFNRVSGVFNPIIEGLAGEPVNVVITLGATGDPADLGPLPANVRADRYIPLSTVLLHADVVVSHGGRSTVLATLSHGLPSLLLPLGSDQNYNAFRVAACGAGLTLERPSVSPGTVRDAVRTLLEEPIYRLNAERLAGEIERMPSTDLALSLIARLVVEKKPIHFS